MTPRASSSQNKYCGVDDCDTVELSRVPSQGNQVGRVIAGVFWAVSTCVPLSCNFISSRDTVVFRAIFNESIRAIDACEEILDLWSTARSNAAENKGSSKRPGRWQSIRECVDETSAIQCNSEAHPNRDWRSLAAVKKFVSTLCARSEAPNPICKISKTAASVLNCSWDRPVRVPFCCLKLSCRLFPCVLAVEENGRILLELGRLLVQQVLLKYFDGTRGEPVPLMPVRISLEQSGTVLFTSGSEPVDGITFTVWGAWICLSSIVRLEIECRRWRNWDRVSMTANNFWLALRRVWGRVMTTPKAICSELKLKLPLSANLQSICNSTNIDGNIECCGKYQRNPVDSL